LESNFRVEVVIYSLSIDTAAREQAGSYKEVVALHFSVMAKQSFAFFLFLINHEISRLTTRQCQRLKKRQIHATLWHCAAFLHAASGFLSARRHYHLSISFFSSFDDLSYTQTNRTAERILPSAVLFRSL
jgi:hypothetical protein